jgi:hypothetical protein
MRAKIFLIIGLTAVLTTMVGTSNSSVLLGGSQQPDKQKKWEDPTTLHARVKQEKNQGAQRVSFSRPLVEYPDVDLPTALAETTLVIADVTEKQSRLIDSNTIGTFYRLSVVETLSKPNASACCKLNDEDFPTDLPALGDNEMYMAGIGGTLVLDGIEVTVDEEFKEMLPYRRYLLFLTTTSSGKSSSGMIGPKGVFLIKSDGRLESLVNKSYKLRLDIERTFNNSLVRLKESRGRKS